MSHSLPTVLIAGAGLGGLCLAQGLRAAGIPVAVYERDRAGNSRRQGYRLHLDPAASRALHSCMPSALFDRFRETSSRPATRGPLLLDALGHEQPMPAGGPPIAAFPDPLHPHRAVDRSVLRRVLSEGLDSRLHFDKEAVGYEILENGRVRLHFQDGDSVSGDLLIGADGVSSKIRRQLLPNAAMNDTGMLCLYGKTFVGSERRASFSHLLSAAFTIARGPGLQSLFVGPFLFPHGLAASDFGGGLAPDDYLMWVLVAPRERFQELGSGNASPAQTAAAFISGWDPLLQEMVLACEPESCELITIRESAPVKQLESGPVTLLGDAIHAMVPAGGRGASAALQDAALLHDGLISVRDGKKSLAEAVHEYNAAMLDSGFAAVRESRAMAETLFGVPALTPQPPLSFG